MELFYVSCCTYKLWLHSSCSSTHVSTLYVFLSKPVFLVWHLQEEVISLFSSNALVLSSSMTDIQNCQFWKQIRRVTFTDINITHGWHTRNTSLSMATGYMATCSNLVSFSPVYYKELSNTVLCIRIWNNILWPSLTHILAYLYAFQDQ